MIDRGATGRVIDVLLSCEVSAYSQEIALVRSFFVASTPRGVYKQVGTLPVDKTG